MQRRHAPAAGFGEDELACVKFKHRQCQLARQFGLRRQPTQAAGHHQAQHLALQALLRTFNVDGDVGQLGHGPMLCRRTLATIVRTQTAGPPDHIGWS
jgi:hypothetical protein